MNNTYPLNQPRIVKFGENGLKSQEHQNLNVKPKFKGQDDESDDDLHSLSKRAVKLP